jgi:galactokinase
MNAARSLASRFHLRFGGTPRVFRAPGRVNLIGEHTDYNDGFVLPAAIQFGTRVAIAPAPSRYITVRSENVSEEFVLDPNEREPTPRHDWTDYIRGVAVILQRNGLRVNSANVLIDGDVPLGSGLSSSASLEVATALALLANGEYSTGPKEIALLCQRAENEFVGARCGIMDQFTACHATASHALLLDCRSLEHRQIPLPERVTMAVSNTMVKHELASGEYNRRREQCEEGVRVLSQFLPGISALRDVTLEQLDRFGGELDPVVLRRCRHAISENARVLSSEAALQRGDLTEFGKLMRCSHCSLREDYEVSSPELDVMADAAYQIEGVYGSRMTGGGFGGCAVSLVGAAHAENFARAMCDAYLKATGIRCEIYLCTAADGASEEFV